MKEKKQKGIEMELTMTFGDKEALKDFIEKFGKAIGKEQAEALKAVVEEEADKEPEAFCPKEGDICTCVLEDNIDAIFRYDGKTRTDEDGNVWLDGDLGLTWSGDLFKPYMVIHGEDAEYHRDCCRLATEEEIALFRNKVKKFEAVQNANGKWMPKNGDDYWAPDFDAGFGNFSPTIFTWNEDGIDFQTYNRGWIFIKEADCQVFCDKLNEAIKSVKR